MVEIVHIANIPSSAHKKPYLYKLVKHILLPVSLTTRWFDSMTGDALLNNFQETKLLIRVNS